MDPVVAQMFELNKALYARSVAGPPREVGSYLLFTTDAPLQTPRFEQVLDATLQYAPRENDPDYDYSWMRHLRLD